MVLQLQLIGIHVLQQVHALVFAQFKLFNGLELRKIFQQQTARVKPLKELVLQNKMRD
jgi:hypothetical protein